MLGRGKRARARDKQPQTTIIPSGRSARLKWEHTDGVEGARDEHPQRQHGMLGGEHGGGRGFTVDAALARPRLGSQSNPTNVSLRLESPTN